ncbi:hypothetical protein ACIA8E_41930, partial [Streptomyces sp. NPDC051664]|uniref:hypothetical protein n=1 Tax=Streptomyces sp. NPDC051664 TaxID=3365668 RepID=UPI0037B4F018
IFPAPTGPDHPAYSQYTFGVPVSGLMEFLDTVQSHLTEQPTIPAVPLFIWSRSFGQRIAAHYAAEILRTTVNPGDVPFLQDLEGVSQVAGYTWLFANHAAAFPMTRLGALNPRKRFLTKNWLAVANRNYFHQLLQQLNPEVQEFFKGKFTYISEMFATQFINFITARGYSRDAYSSNSNVLEEGVENVKGDRTSMRNYLRYVMTGSTQDGGRDSPALHGMSENYLDMDWVDRSTPLALLEIRYSSGDSSDTRMHSHEFEELFSEYARAVNVGHSLDGRQGISPNVAQGILRDEKVRKFSLVIEAIQGLPHLDSLESDFLEDFLFSVTTSVGKVINRWRNLHSQDRMEFENLLASLRAVRDQSDVPPEVRYQFGAAAIHTEIALQSMPPRR